MFEKTQLKDKMVLERIEYLLKAKLTHRQLGEEMIIADDGALYPLDIFVFSAINRSLNLLVPFCELIKEKNIIAAAPLIRMQLDNALRLYAGTLIDDPHTFSLEVLKGTHVRKLKDRNGKKMTDAYLVEQLSSQLNIDWLSGVYDNTSGYVHFSNKHMFNSFSSMDRNGFTMKITLGEHDVEDKQFLEAIDAFISITELVFKMIGSWIHVKNNPIGKEV